VSAFHSMNFAGLVTAGKRVLSTSLNENRPVRPIAQSRSIECSLRLSPEASITMSSDPNHCQCQNDFLRTICDTWSKTLRKQKYKGVDGVTFYIPSLYQVGCWYCIEFYITSVQFNYFQ